jgi:branched-chain amino acid transport system permease protein
VQLGISAILVYAVPLTNGPVGIFGVRRPEIGDFRFGTERSYYYLILAAAAVVFIVMRALLNSRTGRAYEAIREDEDAARSLGIRAARYKVSAFVVGALCASLAGSLYAHFNRFVSPESFDVSRSIQVLTMAVVGGLGSNVGAVVGAGVVVLLPEYLIGLMPEGGANIGLFQSLIFGAVMLIVLIFAPGGIAGLARRVRAAGARIAGRRARGAGPAGVPGGAAPDGDGPAATGQHMSDVGKGAP